MNRNRFVLLAITLVAFIAISLAAGAAPDATKIAQQCALATKAIMDTSKTYQTTWETSVNAGAQGSIMIGLSIKRIAAQGKTSIRVSPIGQPTGKLAAGVGMANLTIVDDGKTAFMYVPLMGGYQKKPHSGGNPAVNFINIPSGPQLTYKYVRADNLAGHPVHVIQVVPPQRQAGGSQMILMFIDQATNRLRQMTVSASSPNPMQKNGPPIKQEMKMVQKSETIDGPIPANAFVFTPPAGTKELKGGPGGGMGMGGMMGRPR